MNPSQHPLLALLLSAPASLLAATFDGPDGHKFDLTGFTKHEWTHNASRARVVPNDQSAYSYDSRNVLSKPAQSQVNRAGRDSQLSMQQLSLGWAKETAGAVGMEARLTYRWRSDDALVGFDNPDVDYLKAGAGLLSRDFTEKFLGISRPDLGAIKYGTQLSRSWSRSDAFSFPVGQSGTWADSGAGFGIFPSALRLTSPMFEDGSGKLTGEITIATDKKNTFMVDQNRATASGVTFSPNPSTPRATEVFLQYSNSKNLIELTVQSAKGAKQTSFGKSALVGWIGDPDTLTSAPFTTPRRAAAPSQSVVILQGNHWANPQNMYTWGLRRSQWSGSAASCNYNTALGSCAFGLDPGFNYGSAADSYLGYKATTFDAMLGWSRYQGPYTYTLSGVYFGHASSKNPVEWGQSNSALHINLGVARKVPEVNKGLTVTAGVGSSFFEKIGPAPVSMPNNNFLGANPLYTRRATSATVGLTWTF
jgi:hypothetical protein